MKKLSIVALILVLCLLATGAMAAGKISVDQENFHVVPSYSTYAYAYAKVSNTGNKPTKLNAGLLEILDEDGEAITSEDYVRAYAEYLQPGEYTYCYLYSRLEDDQVEHVDDYQLTLTGKSDSDQISLRLPVSDVRFEANVQEGWSTYDYMYMTVTNNTNEPIFDIELVYALLDDEGNILFMDGDSLGYSKALMPGSSIMVRRYLDTATKDYFESKGYVPTTLDVIAFVNIDTPEGYVADAPADEAPIDEAPVDEAPAEPASENADE